MKVCMYVLKFPCLQITMNKLQAQDPDPTVITDISPQTVPRKTIVILLFSESVELHFSKSLGLSFGTIFGKLTYFLRQI